LTLRGYQIKAMDAIAQPFDVQGRRKFLSCLGFTVGLESMPIFGRDRQFFS
jgi:hypothetical protein